jgi:hypothetical protein
VKQLKVSSSQIKQRATKRRTSPLSPCLMWQGNCDIKGYARYGRVRIARLILGLTDPKIMALHKCDNPSCVNPKHLYAGTHTDNVRDALERNRYKTNEGHGSTKYDRKLVVSLRKEYRNGSRIIDLMTKYKMPRTSVHNIVYHKRRTHV